MSSDEFRFQEERIQRLVSRECPGFAAVFDEKESLTFRFSLQHVETGKRSGHSVAASGAEIRKKDDASLRKLMRLMAQQCHR